jgi:hypothetical protein
VAVLNESSQKQNQRKFKIKGYGIWEYGRDKKFQKVKTHKDKKKENEKRKVLLQFEIKERNFVRTRRRPYTDSRAGPDNNLIYFNFHGKNFC